jgi:hypothetical protein
MGRRGRQAARAGRAVGGALVPAGTFRKVGGGLGGKLGRAAGDLIGVGDLAGGLGSALGDLAGGAISSIFGFGDYSVKENSLFKAGTAVDPGQSVPSFGNMTQCTRVHHREYVGDVLVPASPTAFDLTSYVINPGNAGLFPWLSSMAANYQQYRFRGMVIEYRTMSSDISAGGALGSVVLATNYNVLDSNYSDKLHMENSQYAVSAKPSKSQVHSIECDPEATASKLLYVRSAVSSSTASQDSRLYDLGNFQLATVGLPGSEGEVLGELWVSYDIELYKPLIVDFVQNSAKVTGGTNVSDTNIFGDVPIISGNVVTAEDNTITFNRQGQYLMVHIFAGTGIDNVNASTYFSSTGTITKLTQFLEDTTDRLVMYTVVVDVGDTVTFDCSAATTVTSCNLRVAPYASANA